MIEYTDQVCDVSPFTSEYEPMRNIPVAKTATAYDHPYDHETYIHVTASDWDITKYSLTFPQNIKIVLSQECRF